MTGVADFAQDEEVRSAFREASAALGYDLWALIQEGPAERLNSTEYQQPAMLAAGVALWRLWKARGGADPGEVSGHSLGEFTALVCAQALSLGAAVDLVRYRGQVMQQAVPAGTGAITVGANSSAFVTTGEQIFSIAPGTNPNPDAFLATYTNIVAP